MVSQIVDKPNIELMWGLFYMFLILILIAEGNYGWRIQLASATGTIAMVQGLSPQLRGLSPSQWWMDQMAIFRLLADKQQINPGVAPPAVALLFLLAQNE